MKKHISQNWFYGSHRKAALFSLEECLVERIEKPRLLSLADAGHVF
jgi:hypothetical protein